MGLNFDFTDGQTLLEEEEKEGLLIPTIATRGELDEYEQQNIEETVQWIYGKRFRADIILTEKFIRNLHKRMYGNVWSWAGDFRLTNKNLGIDKWQIPVSLKNLCDDARYWIENNVFDADETAIRFKHRIVSIHCFPNGNGRHSRLMADILIEKVHKLPVFTWGAAGLVQPSSARSLYINAVRAADKGDYRALIEFARS